MEKMEFPNDLKMTREQIVAEIKCLVQDKCSVLDIVMEDTEMPESLVQEYTERKQRYRNVVRYVRENLQ